MPLRRIFRKTCIEVATLRHFGICDLSKQCIFVNNSNIDDKKKMKKRKKECYVSYHFNLMYYNKAPSFGFIESNSLCPSNVIEKQLFFWWPPFSPKRFSGVFRLITLPPALPLFFNPFSGLLSSSESSSHIVNSSRSYNEVRARACL